MLNKLFPFDKNAINTVRERLDKIKTAYAKIETSREVVETDKSLIQGTIDAGVLGGLPKYKVDQE